MRLKATIDLLLGLAAVGPGWAAVGTDLLARTRTEPDPGPEPGQTARVLPPYGWTLSCDG
jgi:hypothetical protein